jgi:iron complex transport system permease protein
VVVLAALAGASLFLGRYPAPGFSGFGVLNTDILAQRLLLNLRLPRVIAAILLGGALAGSGMVFQMIFSNPLVEPGFLGVSQGAAFGAALAIVVIGAGPVTVQLSALGFALVGLAASYLLARLFSYGGWILRLILAGIAVSALFSAGIGLLKFTADPMSELPEITFWLLGGLWSVTWNDVVYLLPPVTVGLTILLLFRWKLNILSLDDRVAHALGGAPRRNRLLLLFAATLTTSAVISVSGLVGWAGLMIPHAARRMYGTDTKIALPASMILGAVFMLICDDLARTVMTGEIPLGILASLIGACSFLFLMATRRKAKGG